MGLSFKQLIARAEEAKRESKYVDFKVSFDPSSQGEWCELTKDIVAMANSGGGVLIIGADNAGIPTGFDIGSLLTLDPAKLTDKIASHTGQQFDNFHLNDIPRGAERVFLIVVCEADEPLVFEKEGSYQTERGKHKTAFHRGVIYVRHGAKSEPATADDVRRMIKQRVDRLRRQWLGNVRKLVAAPPDATVRVLPKDALLTDDVDAKTVRVVDDPRAPGVHLRDENIRLAFPMDYRELTKLLRPRYTDFKSDRRFHRIKRRLEGEAHCCRTRHLDPNNKRSGSKKFYSDAIFAEFDKHYTPKPNANT